MGSHRRTEGSGRGRGRGREAEEVVHTTTTIPRNCSTSGGLYFNFLIFQIQCLSIVGVKCSVRLGGVVHDRILSL